jgi:hypothetical protein
MSALLAVALALAAAQSSREGESDYPFSVTVSVAPWIEEACLLGGPDSAECALRAGDELRRALDALAAKMFSPQSAGGPELHITIEISSVFLDANDSFQGLGHPRHLVRWGQKGLALVTDRSRVYVYSGAFVQ